MGIDPQALKQKYELFNSVVIYAMTTSTFSTLPTGRLPLLLCLRAHRYLPELPVPYPFTCWCILRKPLTLRIGILLLVTPIARADALARWTHVHFSLHKVVFVVAGSRRQLESKKATWHTHYSRMQRTQYLLPGSILPRTVAHSRFIHCMYTIFDLRRH